MIELPMVPTQPPARLVTLTIDERPVEVPDGRNGARRVRQAGDRYPDAVLRRDAHSRQRVSDLRGGDGGRPGPGARMLAQSRG